MNLDHVKSFVKVVNNNSFSKAADELFMTQPAVSNHIAKLESELATNLLIRNSKEILLTQQGQLFYEYALNIIQLEKNIKNQLNDYETDISGYLKIMASTVPERYYLIDQIRQFHREYPAVKFIIQRSDSREIIKNINNSTIDFGIVGTKLLDQCLVYEPIMEDEVVLIANKKHFDTTDFLSLEELYHYDFISREQGSGTRKEVEKYLEQNGLNYDNLDIKFILESNDSIMRMLKEGKYLTFLSKKVFEDEKYAENDYKIITLEDKIKRSFYFVYHKNRILSPLSRKFKTFIKK